MKKAKRKRYAIDQHDYICKMLGVGNGPDDPGDSAIEAVFRLKEPERMGVNKVRWVEVNGERYLSAGDLIAAGTIKDKT